MFKKMIYIPILGWYLVLLLVISLNTIFFGTHRGQSVTASTLAKKIIFDITR